MNSTGGYTIFVKRKGMKNVGVICGGFTSEYEISLLSAQTIVDNFPKKYNAIRIIIRKGSCLAEWQGEKYPFDIETMSFQSAQEKVTIDLSIIYVHGSPGEDGKIQGMLDMYGHPYLNSGPLASELSFDKWYCNQFLKGLGFNVAESQLLLKTSTYDKQEIIDRLGLPLFIKPTDSGSSYGISKVKEIGQFDQAVDGAFKEGDLVVVESFLDGIEVTCAVYRKEDELHAMPLAEIVTKNEFFDFDAKYNGESEEIIPARIDSALTHKIQETAKKIYTIMRFKSVARVDFMIVNNEPYIIEINTIPGFSSASLVPQMIAADNNTIENFWQSILTQEGY